MIMYNEMFLNQKNFLHLILTLVQFTDFSNKGKKRQLCKNTAPYGMTLKVKGLISANFIKYCHKYFLMTQTY